jgi:uncharacterized protein (DUF2336 family)
VRADSSLLSTLEDIVERGSSGRRAELLKRIANLFVESANSFSEEQVQFFDDVFNRLISEIEAAARFELSVSLAEVGNAPPRIVRRLALDEDSSVARPVLQRSLRLEEPDLLDVAKSKSQGHLLAISNRAQITAPITDVLVQRGDREVLRNVAKNSGARLSQTGFSTLVRKAAKDGILAEEVGQREDIPQQLFRELLVQATQVVQKRLFAAARPETRAKIQRVLDEISSGFEINIVPRDYGAAQSAILEIQRVAKLNEAALAKMAGDGHYEETVAALSALCKIPIKVMHRIMENKRADPELVVCKASGFAWSTARAIILLRTDGRGMSSLSLDGRHRNFEKLSMSGAQDVLRLWCTLHEVD